MNLEYLAFTAQGMELAAALARALGGTPARCGAPEGLAGWTARAFRQAEGLVFVGAAGHIEIWSQERWDGLLQEEESVENIAERMADLGLGI